MKKMLAQLTTSDSVVMKMITLWTTMLTQLSMKAAQSIAAQSIAAQLTNKTHQMMTSAYQLYSNTPSMRTTYKMIVITLKKKT